jgi:hypothetical protein
MLFAFVVSDQKSMDVHSAQPQNRQDRYSREKVDNRRPIDPIMQSSTPVWTSTAARVLTLKDHRSSTRFRPANSGIVNGVPPVRTVPQAGPASEGDLLHLAYISGQHSEANKSTVDIGNGAHRTHEPSLG